MSAERRRAICLCHFCGSWLVFGSDRGGEVVNCPECFQETVLYVPEVQWPPGLKASGLEIRRLNWTATEQGHRCIAGDMINLSDRNLGWVRVQFQLFDGADLFIGAVSDCLIGFEANQVWKFRVPVFEVRAVRASMPLISTEFGEVIIARKGGATQPRGLMAQPEPPPQFNRWKPKQKAERHEIRNLAACAPGTGRGEG